jgi:ubiquinone/menaquinone biosynthesis C-methylase UbiE
LGDLDFLSFRPNFSSPRIIAAYDELPLWSATFGLLLLDEVPLMRVRKALDVGCGTGFPLIELTERLGPAAEVHGVDVWTAGLQRCREKVEARATCNIHIHETSAESMPFANETFDLIVSNLGVNNFENRDAAIRECRRVAQCGATIALTTNLQGHMKEFYDVFRSVLKDDDDLTRLEEHVHHRATVPDVRALLQRNDFVVRRVVQRESVMRFSNGAALFNHHFIKLAFLDEWKKTVPGREELIFRKLLNRLTGEVGLTIPMAYLEGVAV